MQCASPQSKSVFTYQNEVEWPASFEAYKGLHKGESVIAHGYLKEGTSLKIRSIESITDQEQKIQLLSKNESHQVSSDIDSQS